jgi:beta-mannanase
MRRHHTAQAPGATPATYTATKLAASVGSGTQTKAQVDAFNSKIAPRSLNRLMFFTSLEGTVLRSEFTTLMEETGMEEMVLAWLPSNNTATVNYGPEIREGKKDAAIKAAFEAMKTWNKPIVIRLAHEFNGNWYPYGAGFGTKTETTGTNKKGETATEFKEWWQRLVGIKNEVVCPKVSIAWNPNTWGGASQVDPSTYYPGDAYVDYVGLDSYMDAGTTARQPSTLFKSAYETLKSLAPTKPFCIFETGCAASGADSGGTLVKSAWFTNLAYLVANEIPVAHLSYFNRTNGANDYTIDSSGTDTSAREAFKVMVNNPRFV